MILGKKPQQLFEVFQIRFGERRLPTLSKVGRSTGKFFSNGFDRKHLLAESTMSDEETETFSRVAAFCVDQKRSVLLSQPLQMDGGHHCISDSICGGLSEDGNEKYKLQTKNPHLHLAFAH